jgi:hypothetical protein
MEKNDDFQEQDELSDDEIEFDHIFMKEFKEKRIQGIQFRPCRCDFSQKHRNDKEFTDFWKENY